MNTVGFHNSVDNLKLFENELSNFIPMQLTVAFFLFSEVLELPKESEVARFLPLIHDFLLVFGKRLLTPVR